MRDKMKLITLSNGDVQRVDENGKVKWTFHKDWNKERENEVDKNKRESDS